MIADEGFRCNAHHVFAAFEFYEVFAETQTNEVGPLFRRFGS